MLLSFSVSNFRSFREEQTFSMVANNRAKDHPEHLRPIPGDENKVLPVAVLYGANGAGKSNLVKAILFLKKLIDHGGGEGGETGRVPFLFGDEDEKLPTGITIQFTSEDTIYEFGVKVTDTLIQEEWLSAVTDGKNLPIYVRATSEARVVSIELGESLKADPAYEKIRALQTLGVWPSQLFLNGVRSAPIPDKDKGEFFVNVLSWLSVSIQVINPTSSVPLILSILEKIPQLADYAGSFLNQAGTGINNVSLTSNKVDESVIRNLSEEQFSQVERLPKGKELVIPDPNFSHLKFKRSETIEAFHEVLLAEHKNQKGEIIYLPFAEESEGTQRLMHLLPALKLFEKQDRVFIIDEIDRSLHPLLAKRFVREFIEKCAPFGGQLIFTTHETAFLDLDLLRRDEIWFADKKPNIGATELYSLSDFKARTDKDIEKAYLEGRYDAVPPVEVKMPDWVNAILEELKPKQTN
jgi:AAA15 family ATPase/GTPase